MQPQRQHVRTDLLKTRDPRKASYLLNDTLKRATNRRCHAMSFSLRLKFGHQLSRQLRRNYNALVERHHHHHVHLSWGSTWTMTVAAHQRQYSLSHQRRQDEQKRRDAANEPYRNAEAIDRVNRMTRAGWVRPTDAGVIPSAGLELKRLY